MKPQHLETLALALAGFFRRLGIEAPLALAVPWPLWLEGWHERAKTSLPLRALVKNAEQLVTRNPDRPNWQ